MIHESLRENLTYLISFPGFIIGEIAKARHNTLELLCRSLISAFFRVRVRVRFRVRVRVRVLSCLHEASSWTWSFVLRKTGALSLQTLKSWMRMWSMRRENRNLTSRMRTRANRSRQVGFDRFSWCSSASVCVCFMCCSCRRWCCGGWRGRRHHCWPHSCFLQQVVTILTF